jgi:hypothetical protein
MVSGPERLLTVSRRRPTTALAAAWRAGSAQIHQVAQVMATAFT